MDGSMLYELHCKVLRWSFISLSDKRCDLGTAGDEAGGEGFEELDQLCSAFGLPDLGEAEHLVTLWQIKGSTKDMASQITKSHGLYGIYFAEAPPEDGRAMGATFSSSSSFQR
ncbi:unnamed protein product [Durusdinium trenchii]|uniref:Defective in cullin neddylation protein n=2 Tax=Durusdinium trenchii TaxID=1381693 RepID=A0ABP0LT39_9DINO